MVTCPSTKSVDCLADFNAARERAGLEAFTEEKEANKKLPTGESSYIDEICSAIKEASGLHLPYHCQTDTQKKLPTGDETYIGKICSAIQEASGLHMCHHCRDSD
ncbi:SAG family member [Eimeria mitis]|uniref:SAG family member n=1 Tax=Eimeria mitis TaxID=44415 RepID=U6JTJ1_9EIME|nr:SAG family member [Eimeria mitis]CDJ28744.1 SAG family member [Eimeria mitis]